MGLTFSSIFYIKKNHILNLSFTKKEFEYIPKSKSGSAIHPIIERFLGIGQQAYPSSPITRNDSTFDSTLGSSCSSGRDTALK